MNAIYATTPSSKWVDVAEQLEEDEDIHPVYWICTGSLKEDVRNEYPDIVVHDSYDCIRGKFHSEYNSDNFLFPVDEEVLESLTNFESIALKMMDRLDPGNIADYEFSYTDRIRKYHRSVSYWLKVIEEENPDLAIFGNAPHLVSDYILYAVCDHKDVDTLILTPSSLPETFFVRSKVNEMPELEEKIDKQISHDAIEDHIDRISNSYEEAQPEYMEDQRGNLEFPGLKSTLSDVAGRLINLRGERENPNFKELDKRIEDSNITNWFWLKYRIKSRIYRMKLKKHYSKLSKKPDLSKKYVYFPLHYQPERTTCPEAGQFVHQYLIVNLLARELPSDIQIYIKEHPSQFSSSLKGELGRKTSFYDDIIDYENVHLISEEVSTFDLIDNSFAVATATGTAGWEALIREKPALVFGNAWYQHAPECYRIKTKEDFEKSLKSIYASSGPTVGEIKKFAALLDRQGYDGGVLNENNFDVEEVSKAIKESL